MDVRSVRLCQKPVPRRRICQINISNGAGGSDEGADTPSIWNLCAPRRRVYAPAPLWYALAPSGGDVGYCPVGTVPASLCSLDLPAFMVARKSNRQRLTVQTPG